MTPNHQIQALERAINDSTMGWTLCFVGENQANKLKMLIDDLNNDASFSGNGKQITSGFSYWGIGPTISWAQACNDPFYVVMKESIESFDFRWQNIQSKIAGKEFHYVSLGVGTGEKDRSILNFLLQQHQHVLYFPVDMSQEMLRIGVQGATKGSPIRGSQVLPVQIDFSLYKNVEEFRRLLDNITKETPILFSLLGNTLANFEKDTELLQILSLLMKPQDRLLIEVAATDELNEDAARAAANEYAKSRSFVEFVTSALLQNTDLHINRDEVTFIPSLEADRAIRVVTLYQNQSESTIKITLPDRSIISFPPKDTIRLYLTRKYTKTGIEQIIRDCNFTIEDRERYVPKQPQSKQKFGIDLLLISINPPDTLQTDIQTSLLSILPNSYHVQAEKLATTIAAVVRGQLSPNLAQQYLSGEANLAAILGTLAGQQVITPTKVVEFGCENQIGDVNIRDIAGGSINNITIHAHFSPESPE